jgi:hypothetical protein
LANMTTRRGPPLWALVATALRLMTASEPATFICCPTPPRRLACISAVRRQGGAMCRCCALKPGVRTLVGPLAVPRPGLPTKLLCWLTGHAAALWVLVMMVRRRGVTEVSRPPSTVTASALPPSHGTRVYEAPLLIVLVLFVVVGGRPPLIHSTRDALVLPAARGATELIAMASGRLSPPQLLLAVVGTVGAAAVAHPVPHGRRVEPGASDTSPGGRPLCYVGWIRARLSALPYTTWPAVGAGGRRPRAARARGGGGGGGTSTMRRRRRRFSLTTLPEDGVRRSAAPIVRRTVIVVIGRRPPNDGRGRR